MTQPTTAADEGGSAAGHPDHPDPDHPDPYGTLPARGPYGVEIGSALITMVEPHPGQERAYNRWYEDDHFYAGAMAMPWMFAGRRWVSPRDLQALRLPEDSAVAKPVRSGPYISIYWLTAGRQDDHMRWTVATNRRLLSDGRVFLERDHVFTAFQRYLGAHYRDGAAGTGTGAGPGPRDVHALDYPYGGLVVEVIDAPEGGRGRGVADVAAWLEADRAPAVFGATNAVAMGLVFTPLPLPETRMSYVRQVEGLGRRVTVLWFVESDPREVWDAAFADAPAQAAKSGVGRCEFVAPFVPTLPGTDRYVDDLR